MLRRNSLILLFLVLSIIQIFGQREYAMFQDILELQQKRVISDKKNSLLKYLEEDNDDVVMAALLAFANVGDTSKKVINEISERLSDPEETVRYAASFTLGNLRSSQSERALLNALNKEKSNRVIAAILNSLGRIGSENALYQVSTYGSASEEVNAAISMSIARFGMRRIMSTQGHDKLYNMFMPSSFSQDPEVIKNTTYAISRAVDSLSLNRFKPLLAELVKYGDPVVRMWAYSALGKSKDFQLADLFIDGYRVEGDWRVKVNILNALGNLNGISGNNEALTFLISRVNEINEHIVIASLNAIQKVFMNAEQNEIIKDKLISTVNNSAISDAARGRAAAVLADLFKDNVSEDLFRSLRETESYNLKADIITALGNFNDVSVYKTVRDTISSEVMRYNEKNPNKTGDLIGSEDLAKMYRGFLTMLLMMQDRMNDEDKNIVRLIYSEFLNSGDAAVTSLAVDGILNEMYSQHRPETIQIMLFDYPNLKSSEMRQAYVYALGELKAMQAVDLLKNNLKSDDIILARESAAALYKITNDIKYQEREKKLYNPDLDWNYFSKIMNKKNAEIVTNKGIINVELFPEFAPFTVMNFLKLADKGFYNNVKFHRVVPNFVIQAGDPTGTGYSGPGYTIRTEIAPVGFEPGYLGMASSGKDTEGSQFFITHSPQPHLDGIYTVFGRVTEGMDIVDNILKDDIIVEIR